MRTLVGVVVLVLSGLTAPAAYAESWSAADRAGDVRVTHVHLEPDPLRCVQPQPQRTRRDGRRDVLGLAVDHGADDVVVTVALREVPRRDPRTVVTFSLRTPQHRYVVSLQPDESGRTLEGTLDQDPSVDVDREHCLTSIGSVLARCTALSAVRDPGRGQVVLTVPRGCLESPEWVRAGVGASGFVHPSMLRFRVFRDVWGPRGTPTGPYLPPFGPRVHAG